MKKAKFAVIALVCLALIVGYYFYLTHREPKDAGDDVKVTELDEVLSKQLDNSYPATPREVIKFYNRIIECAYAGKYDSAQFDRLVTQARALMDDELLTGNPEADYKHDLQQEVTTYQEMSQKIIQTNVGASDEVEFCEIEGRECAYVTASYFIKTGKSSFSRTYQQYLLRKDEKDRWKILAYSLVDGEK